MNPLIIKEVDVVNCIAYYECNVNKVNPKFNDVLHATVEKEEDNVYHGWYVDAYGDIHKKEFTNSRDAQKYVLNLFNNDISYFANFKTNV